MDFLWKDWNGVTRLIEGRGGVVHCFLVLSLAAGAREWALVQLSELHLGREWATTF